MPCARQWSGNPGAAADVGPPGLNFASVICVGATGKSVRVASFAQAAAGSGGVAARLADAPKLAADTPTKTDPTTENGSCRRCRCFISALPRLGPASVLRPRGG